MKRQLAGMALVMAIVAGGAVNAQAFGRGDCGEGDRCRDEQKINPQKRLDRMSKVLKLTASQKVQIEAIMKAEQAQAEPLRKKVNEGRKQFQAAVNVETFDEAAVRAIAEEQARNKVEMQLLRAKAMNQVNALLTTEQRDLAQRLRDARPGKHDRKGRHSKSASRQHRNS